jgi:hypothetical protein
VKRLNKAMTKDTEEGTTTIALMCDALGTTCSDLEQFRIIKS